MKYLLLALSAFLFTSCQKKSDENHIEVLLQLNDEQRTAHLEGDADLLVAQMADTLTMIQDGVVSKVAKEDVRARFASYFPTVRYTKWDDITDPEILFSDDYSMATVTVIKEIESAPVLEDSIGTYEANQWAWVTIYQKKAGDWKMTRMSSGVKR